MTTGRGSDVPEDVLGDEFGGHPVHDGETAYPAFPDALKRCWAPVVRGVDFREPDVLRKVDGAVRTGSGELVRETLRSLLAASGFPCETARRSVGVRSFHRYTR